MHLRVEEITQAESSRLLIATRRTLKSTPGWERYTSPDERGYLELKEAREVPFGPKLFTAKAVVANDCWKLSSGVLNRPRFLSPGCFGLGFDNWSGDPWSFDSGSLALVEVESLNRVVKSNLKIFELRSRARSVLASAAEGLLSHHMWSKCGKYYLYKDAQHWFLTHLDDGKKLQLATTTGHPKHCFFVSGHILLAEADISVISPADGSVVTSEARHKYFSTAKELYSFYDQGGDRVIIGANPQLLREVKCDRWWSIMLV